MRLRPAPDPGSGRLHVGLAEVPERVDLVVAGLGITGAGIALDAVTRGLTVLAVDAHDVAFGTSRWSSKLVHGGLRYLATGQVRIARESAVERRILMEATAPHLVHPMPMLAPLTSSVSPAQAALTRFGFSAGDLLRRSAGTAVETLPRPRRLTATETLGLAPDLRRAGLRGGLLSWDGQLVDDARLVIGVARTAAAFGAHVRTRTRVLSASADSVELRDETTGEQRRVRTSACLNATGVWAADLADDVRLRPSRGTHLVLRASAVPGLRTAVTAAVPGSRSRYVLVLPQPDGLIYVGLTDEPVDGPVPDVPQPTETEIGFLLDVVAAVFERPLRRDDVVGAYAGLRPLLDGGRGGETADLSRRHAVLTSANGLVTVVGGKLTTYRRMAADALDVALAGSGLRAGACVSDRQPLLGAAPPARLARIEAPQRLVARFGTEATAVLSAATAATGWDVETLCSPLAPGVAATRAELAFGVTHEGARSVADLLERRTRVSMVASDAVAATPAATEVLARTQRLANQSPSTLGPSTLGPSTWEPAG